MLCDVTRRLERGEAPLPSDSMCFSSRLRAWRRLSGPNRFSTAQTNDNRARKRVPDGSMSFFPLEEGMATSAFLTSLGFGRVFALVGVMGGLGASDSGTSTNYQPLRSFNMVPIYPHN